MDEEEDCQVLEVEDTPVAIIQLLKEIHHHIPLAATIAVLSEIWKTEEPTSFTRPYTNTPGPTSPDVTCRSTLGDLFACFFYDQVWNLIETETNRYASSCTETNPSSRAWVDTEVEELKAFVGLLILMGIVKLPRLEMYWSTNFPLIKTPGVSNIMPLKGFEQIWRFLHLNNNSTEVAYGQTGYMTNYSKL